MVIAYKKGANESLSDHFNSSEFDCKCNFSDCDVTYIDTDLVDYLEEKRVHFGSPIIITSGFRCTRWNKRVGGKPGSIHMTGKAADIRLKDRDIAEFGEFFEDADGMCVYDSFVHVDKRGYKARWKA